MKTNQPNQHVSFPTCILPRRSHLHCDVPEEDLSVTSYNPVGASDHVLVGGHVSIACTPQAPTPQQHVETWRWNWDPDRVVALKGALGSMQLLPPAEEIPQLSMSELWSHWHFFFFFFTKATASNHDMQSSVAASQA